MSGEWARAADGVLCDSLRLGRAPERAASWALQYIGWAMAPGTAPRLVAQRSLSAAAEVRAWRKSLPDQGRRFESGATGRAALREAALAVLLADMCGPDDPGQQVEFLREAEAALRSFWLEGRR